MLDKTRKPLFPYWEQKKHSIEKTSDFFIRKMSHSDEKCKRGFVKINSFAKYQKTWRGPYGYKTSFEKKVAQCRKK